ncbi:MAG: MarR family transcriptional regulator [Pseudolabrys sp.]
MKIQPESSNAARASQIAADLRAFFRGLKRRLREQANLGDLTPSQVSVLQRLEQGGPTTVSALARVEGVRPQSMRVTVAALESAGHVEGHPNPSDRRQTIISLTESCRRWIDEGRAARQDWLTRRIASILSPEEQQTLAAAMPLLDCVVGD